MDGQEGGADGSNPEEPRVASDPRLLSNPWVGGFVSDWSPLHEAAVHGRQLTLRKLISQGWLVNIITADHVSPLHEACLGGHLTCANILLRHGAQVNGMTTNWHTPLFNACVSGSWHCVNLLLHYGANLQLQNDLASPIHEAAKRGHVECVDTLVAHGCNIDHNISHLGTPLYLACENQHIACVKNLLQSGADVNQGKGYDTPLHAVASKLNEELVCLLMDFGADTYARNAEGKRPVELVPPESPLAQVFLEREGPPSLMQLCRLRIRKCFGIRQHHKISTLCLPEHMKQFLLHL
ncbi:ankyrin repeat and SOCS box protein 9 [Aotus nancymaae]|uniref:Ankyrin repeat and SOCS box containing 9 n=1 Tax=Aotus nancymaae TaxID=37293 RepID=A0A2K5F4U7_AOTNA|nr:ankyrin repeat and SOCS box protein 9 isoform X1 [Aotus nancymaae]XP_012290230.1 ankyrin repeat and SOCS box protein 9 isoform X1 [Aotus nancymaae]XP_012290239.1 ankyrin repeat and SOCS box protein 9 isoform X1 [Aotus nancymaae]XP_012290248.1 ankyrin repeat and SOCS box protein 9 isoform X1 [Aotus nancymaae]